MSDDLEKRSTQLEQKLEEQRLKDKDQRNKVPDKTKGGAGMAEAFKLSSEFIAAILVGVALGWGFDQLAGTSPFGLIIFLILGFCAGVVNVMRASGSMSDPRNKNGNKTSE